MNKTLKWILIVVVALVAVLFGAKMLLSKDDGSTKVSIEKVQKRTITETVDASGKIYP
jgi:HlyD family secretion protein